MKIEELMRVVESTEKTRELLTRKPDIDRDFLMQFAHWALGVIPEMVAEVRWIQEKQKAAEKMVGEKKPHHEIRAHLDVMDKGRQ